MAAGTAEATGVQLSHGDLGLVLFKTVNSAADEGTSEATTYALVASGEASVIGIPNTVLTGRLTVRVNATGTIVFDSVADLQAGTAGFIFADGSYTQNAADAAAEFERDINSFYVQDQWQVNDSVRVIAGIRFDQYKSSDDPLANPAFEARYGFTNATSFDGLDIVQHASA